jgi:hypothetical protein
MNMCIPLVSISSYSLTWTLITIWLQCWNNFFTSFTVNILASHISVVVLQHHHPSQIKKTVPLSWSTNLPSSFGHNTNCRPQPIFNKSYKQAVVVSVSTDSTTAQQYSDHTTEPLQHAHTYVKINSAHRGFLSSTFISERKQHIMKVGFSKSLVSKPIIIKYNANHIHPNT